MTNSALNRSTVVLLTNKSGGAVAQGDVVVIDIANASAFTTTTVVGYLDGLIGVVLDPGGIANDAVGSVVISGWVPKINLSASASLGDLVRTHSVAKQGVRHAAPLLQGDFAMVLQTGTSPQAELMGSPIELSSGGGQFFAPSGLTGSSNASRYVGGTTSGAPVSGTFNTGDYVIEATGTIYICTAGGSPGTWTQVQASGAARALIGSEQTPTGTGTVTLSSIPNSYKKLTLEAMLRSTVSAAYTSLALQLNGDTTATNYRQNHVSSFGASTVSAEGTNDNNLGGGSGPINGDTGPTGAYAKLQLEIIQYANTGFNKQINYRIGSKRDVSSVFELVITGNMEWANTAAINQIALVLGSGNYKTPSVLRLYGEN